LRAWRQDEPGYRKLAGEFGAALRRRSWAEMARGMIEIMEANPVV